MLGTVHATVQPFTHVPLTDPRSLTMNIYEPNRKVPMIQNMNAFDPARSGKNFLLFSSRLRMKPQHKIYDIINQNYLKDLRTVFCKPSTIRERARTLRCSIKC
jgi:hypothetical protein